MSRYACVSFPALGTTAVLCVGRADCLPAAFGVLRRELFLVDRACSRFRSDSELSGLNRAAGATVRVGVLLFEAVRTALRAAELTDGLVDPTVGAALRAAGYDRTFELVRARDPRTPAGAPAGVPGWRRVELDAERRTVRLPAGAELDLGATAKALAADRAARAASEETGGSVLVSLGGDLAVGGDAPGGGWPVRIADDHRAGLDGPGPTVVVSGGGLATSGTAVRRWRAGDRELHHIVDPRSGRPAETPWRTVSVAAGSCVDANTASTASIVLGADAPAWLEQRRLPARLVSTAGDVLSVAGWPEGP